MTDDVNQQSPARCYGCKYHMGCNRVHHGFVGCRCRKHDHPIVDEQYTNMDAKICAYTCYHFDGAGNMNVCPDWRPARYRGTHNGAQVREWLYEQENKTTCYFCGKPVDPTSPKTHVHHIVPVAKGGAHLPGNTVLAHECCHMAFHNGHKLGSGDD